MNYGDQRREKEAERHAGEEHLRELVLAKIRDVRLENDAVDTRTPAEKGYRGGWNDALLILERWLEARQ